MEYGDYIRENIGMLTPQEVISEIRGTIKSLKI